MSGTRKLQLKYGCWAPVILHRSQVKLKGLVIGLDLSIDSHALDRTVIDSAHGCKILRDDAIGWSLGAETSAPRDPAAEKRSCACQTCMGCPLRRNLTTLGSPPESKLLTWRSLVSKGFTDGLIAYDKNIPFFAGGASHERADNIIPEHSYSHGL